MGLDFTTVASSALGTIGANIKEQATRKAKLEDDIFKDLYAKIDTANETTDQELVNAEQTIRNALAIGLTTETEVDSYLASSPAKRAEMEKLYYRNQSLFTGEEKDRPSVPETFGFTRPEGATTIGQEQIRKIARRYVGILVDPSVTSNAQQKTFGQNVQDQL